KTLPLRKNPRTIAVIGPLADDRRSALGGWAADGRPEETISVLAGIRAALGPSSRVISVRGAPVDAADSSGFADARRAGSVADVLFGDYTPAGKLPVTFPRATGQIPIYYSHRNTGRPPDAAQKYTSKYLDLPSTPLFPFGYGLSYTTFAYSNLRLSAAKIPAGGSVTVSVDVRNSGDRAGDEVVQLYVRDDVASVAEPVKALKGFRRVALRARESRTVMFKLDPDALALYDRQMRRVVEPGTFTA